MKYTNQMSGMKVEFYKSGIFRKGWRWRITAANNKIIAASTESYKNKSSCEDNLNVIYHQLRSYYNPHRVLEEVEKITLGI